MLVPAEFGMIQPGPVMKSLDMLSITLKSLVWYTSMIT